MLSGFTARRYLFSLTAVDALKLPEYKGSTLRGGFGHAFRKVVCTFRGKVCDDCLLRHRCVYSYVFETPPPENTLKMKKYLRAPHPFIIEPPPDKKELYRPGEGLSFGLVLIGRAIDYLPYFIYAFDEMGKTGIGRGKGKYRLNTVSSGDETIYEGATGVLKNREPCPCFVTVKNSTTDDGQQTRVTISFLTPTRLVKDGNLESGPDFQTIFRTLVRRISLLSYFHCGRELDADYKGIIERAEAVETLRKEIRWWDWERWSARQDTKMKMGGFVGDMTFSAEMGEFMPFLELGELVHVGKGTGFGLGMYTMERGV